LNGALACAIGLGLVLAKEVGTVLEERGAADALVTAYLFFLLALLLWLAALTPIPEVRGACLALWALQFGQYAAWSARQGPQ